MMSIDKRLTRLEEKRDTSFSLVIPVLLDIEGNRFSSNPADSELVDSVRLHGIKGRPRIQRNQGETYESFSRRVMAEADALTENGAVAHLGSEFT